MCSVKVKRELAILMRISRSSRRASTPMRSDADLATDVVTDGIRTLNDAKKNLELVGPVGLEPTTRGLKVRCSAN